MAAPPHHLAVRLDEAMGACVNRRLAVLASRATLGGWWRYQAKMSPRMVYRMRASITVMKATEMAAAQRARRVRLLGRDNGAGLGRDMALLAGALESMGLSVDACLLPHRGRWAEWMTRLRRVGKPATFDLQIMLERVRPEFFRDARRQVLIPNPEYFRPRDRAALSRVDAIWTKTRHAGALFEPLGAAVHYLGFCSPDRHLPDVPRRRAFFHGPGRSGNKGTEALLQLWLQHPEWPELTLVWRRKGISASTLPANVTLVNDYLDDEAYRQLQNAHRFHLCPSRTEGYGHYIAEAMSCGAVVVTLDAEPMKELVTAARGVLVPAQRDGLQCLATLYTFEPAAMAAAIEQCIVMTDDRAAELGGCAQQWHRQQYGLMVDRLHAALRASGVDVPNAQGVG